MQNLLDGMKALALRVTRWVKRHGAWGVTAVVGVTALVLFSGVGVTMAATGTLPFGIARDAGPGFATDGPSPTQTTGETPVVASTPTSTVPWGPMPGIPSSLWADHATNFTGIKFTSDANGFYVSYGGVISRTKVSDYISYYDGEFRHVGDALDTKIGEQYNTISVWNFRPDMCTPGVKQIKVSWKVEGLIGASTATYLVPLENYTCPVSVVTTAPVPSQAPVSPSAPAPSPSSSPSSTPSASSSSTTSSSPTPTTTTR